MIAFLYIGGFICIGFVVLAVLWMISPILAGAAIGYLWFREFFKHY